MTPHPHSLSLRHTEVLESDEDELDDNGDEYLEKLGEKVKKASAASPFSITATVEVRTTREEIK